MSKIILILFIYFIIRCIKAGCPDTELYCFDSNEVRIGEIR